MNKCHLDVSLNLSEPYKEQHTLFLGVGCIGLKNVASTIVETTVQKKRPSFQHVTTAVGGALVNRGTPTVDYLMGTVCKRKVICFSRAAFG